MSAFSLRADLELIMLTLRWPSDYIYKYIFHPCNILLHFSVSHISHSVIFVCGSIVSHCLVVFDGLIDMFIINIQFICFNIF